MIVESPTEAPLDVEDELLEFEPQKYWAVWQFPEARYAYAIGWRRQGWLIVMDSEEAGWSYLHVDARQNRRTVDQYRLDELTLDEAFSAARSQSVPFLSSQGVPVVSVLGVQLRTSGFLGARKLCNIPM